MAEEVAGTRTFPVEEVVVMVIAGRFWFNGLTTISSCFFSVGDEEGRTAEFINAPVNAKTRLVRLFTLILNISALCAGVVPRVSLSCQLLSVTFPASSVASMIWGGASLAVVTKVTRSFVRLGVRHQSRL